MNQAAKKDVMSRPNPGSSIRKGDVGSNAYYVSADATTEGSGHRLLVEATRRNPNLRLTARDLRYVSNRSFG